MTPELVVARLSDIFHEFGGEWVNDNPYIENSGFTFHAVLIEFATFLGGHAPAASPRQLEATAEFINEAMDGEPRLENAVATCLLEHLHQLNLKRRLWPLLSDRAKQGARP
jgi:hypothetical protein